MEGLYIDVPGVWAMHCHVGWHLSDGKLAAFVYLPDQVKELDKPEDWSNVSSGSLCIADHGLTPTPDVLVLGS